MKKKLLTLLILIGCSLAGYGQFKFGAGLTADIDDGFVGVTGKAHNIFTDEYAGQVSFSYFFEDNNITYWAIDLDVHYMGWDIGDVEGFNITPFGGLQIARANYDVPFMGNDGDSELGINVGIQGNIPITDELDLFIEPKIIISGLDGFVLSAGVFF